MKELPKKVAQWIVDDLQRFTLFSSDMICLFFCFHVLGEPAWFCSERITYNNSGKDAKTIKVKYDDQDETVHKFLPMPRYGTEVKQWCITCTDEARKDVDSIIKEHKKKLTRKKRSRNTK